MVHYPHVFLHRPVSRIFWFLAGAGVATWWHHSHAMHDHRAQYWPCVMQQRRRAALQDQHPGPAPSESAGYPARDGQPSWTYPTAGTDATVGWNQLEWEDHRERLRNLQKRISDAMVDMSESTLDSIVSAAEALKVKLVENRGERTRPPVDLIDTFRSESREQKKDPSPSV